MALLSRGVVHIHPTLQCNLQCLHCYSHSGPQQRQMLEVADLLHQTRQLRKQGYEIASLSGGEPTLYSGIYELCRGLKKQGYAVSLITNGIVQHKCVKLAQSGLLDNLSVSFDGPEKQHEHTRQREGSFQRSLLTLRTLSKIMRNVGAVVSVSNTTLASTPNMVELLIDSGARHIQFHPIAEIGRAAQNGEELQELDEHSLLRLIVISQILQQAHPEHSIECDALTQQQLADYRRVTEEDIISPLVITASGNLLPIAYGIDSSFKLGELSGNNPKIHYNPRLLELIRKTRRHCTEKKASSFYSTLVHFSRHC